MFKILWTFVLTIGLFLPFFNLSASHHSEDQTFGAFVGLASNKARVSGGGFSMSSSSSSSFIVGASFERDLAFHELLTLQVDPTFAKKGSGAPTFIEVPLLAKYQYDKEIYERTYISGLAGLTPALKLSSGEAGDDVSSFQLGLEFGGEIEHDLKDHDSRIFFGIRYNLGLTDAYSEEFEEVSDMDVKFSSLKFMAGVRMNF